MQKGIKAYKIERFIRKKQQIQSVFFHLVLFPLSPTLSLFLFFWGGGTISINLGLKGEPPQKNIPVKRRVIIYYRSYLSNPTSPPSPLKMNGPQSLGPSLQVPLFKETLPLLVPLNNILFHCWSTMIRIGPIPENISKCRWHRLIVILGDIPLSPPITPSLQL